MSFANWPRRWGPPPAEWGGLKLVQVRDLLLPVAVARQAVIVVDALRERALTLWLSGSAARQKLKRTSDVDWTVILKPGADAIPEGWPTPRHSFHVFEPDCYLTQLARGREFTVWQLAYGKLLVKNPDFAEQLRSAFIPIKACAVRSKKALLRRRRKLIAIQLRAGDFETARQELWELTHQEGRLRLLSAGIVPGCRAEIDEQIEQASPNEARAWKRSAARQSQILASSSRRSVLLGARAAGIADNS